MADDLRRCRWRRAYDEIGLLRPVWTDPDNGYRWCEPEQLRRLHQILALRDLDVRLTEITRLLDENVTVEELRGILLLRRAEAHDRLAAEAERLARVEARLHQLEGATVTDFVVKAMDATWMLTVREDVLSVTEIGFAHQRSWPRLHAQLEELGVERVPPSIARETVGLSPIPITFAVPVQTACNATATASARRSCPASNV